MKVAKIFVSLIFFFFAFLLFKHGSSSAFDLGLFLTSFGFIHPYFWNEKKRD